MIQSCPLILSDIDFRIHGIVGIYSLYDKIAYIHFGTGAVNVEEYREDGLVSSFAMLDVFSLDFSEHNHSHLSYRAREYLNSLHAECYWDNDHFILNTDRFLGVSKSNIAKLIEVHGTTLNEIGDAPTPINEIYNDSKTYLFGDFEIHMASSFTMECRARNSGLLLWKLKLNAYLYTEIEEKDETVYFGTAGHGGRFYAVSIDSGNVVYSYNTGGTVHFLWHEGCILLADRKGKPVLLNAKNGEEIHRIDFGNFKITYDQYLLTKNNRLYAVANDKEQKHMYAVCATI